jgi:hypothetical protein
MTSRAQKRMNCLGPETLCVAVVLTMFDISELLF